MKKNLILATAALLTINLATGAIAWAEPAPAKPAVAAEKIAGTPTKLPGYDQKTRVMVHKSAWANPLCKIDKDSLTAAVNKSILGHGNYLTPTVFFVAPHALPGSTKVLSAYEYGDTLAKAWAKQGLPDSSVVVVALCDATSVKVATVVNGSLVKFLDVNDLKAKEGALRALASTNPTGYAAGVVEYLANAVETKQALIKQVEVTKAQQQAAHLADLQRQRQAAQAIEQQRQAALAADQQRQRQAALAAEQQRQAALAAERQRQAALAANQQRQAAPTASNSSSSSNSNVGLIIMVVVLSLTVLGIVLYLVLRRKDDETPATTYSGSNGGSNRNVGNYTGERRAEGSNRAVGHNKVVPQNRPVVRQPAPANRGGVYQNYNWGGRSYSVMEQDLYGYVPAGVPQSSTGFWLKNIASMVAVYGIMEWLFDHGRRNEALSMGYNPGMSRDTWINSQIAQHQHDLWAGNNYYHAPLMNHDSWGNNSWNGNLDNFAVTQANANDGWDVGATQAQPENLVLGDGSPTDQVNDAITQANAEDGWDVGNNTSSDSSQLVLGDDNSQDDGSMVLGDTEATDNNDHVVLGDDDQSANTVNDPYQVSLGDGEPESAATDNDYQVALGDDQPEAETGSNDGYQSSFGNDETEETGGNDGNYQLTLGDDEPEEETVSNDYQSSFGNDEPEAPAADNNDYQSDVSDNDSNSNDDWT